MNEFGSTYNEPVASLNFTFELLPCLHESWLVSELSDLLAWNQIFRILIKLRYLFNDLMSDPPLPASLLLGSTQVDFVPDQSLLICRNWKDLAQAGWTEDLVIRYLVAIERTNRTRK